MIATFPLLSNDILLNYTQIRMALRKTAKESGSRVLEPGCPQVTGPTSCGRPDSVTVSVHTRPVGRRAGWRPSVTAGVCLPARPCHSDLASETFHRRPGRPDAVGADCRPPRRRRRHQTEPAGRQPSALLRPAVLRRGSCPAKSSRADRRRPAFSAIFCPSPPPPSPPAAGGRQRRPVVAPPSPPPPGRRAHLACRLLLMRASRVGASLSA